MDNVEKIIKTQNKRISNPRNSLMKPCNCRIKASCPLEDKCCVENVIYKCVVAAANRPNKVYIGLTERDFKKRFYNHNKSFSNEKYSKETTLSTYIWELKRNQETPSLTWSIVKSVPPYSNISKHCSLCLHEKYIILTYEHQDELLNIKSEMISKCRHENKYLLDNYKTIKWVINFRMDSLVSKYLSVIK